MLHAYLAHKRERFATPDRVSSATLRRARAFGRRAWYRRQAAAKGFPSLAASLPATRCRLWHVEAQAMQIANRRQNETGNVPPTLLHRLESRTLKTGRAARELPPTP